MWNHAPLLSPLFLLFLTGPLFFALVVSYRDIENEIARKRKEKGKGKTNPREYGSHRWFRMNLSERHPRLSFDSREIWLGVVLYRAVEIEKRSNLDISTAGTAIISVPRRYPAEVVRYLFRRPRSSNPVCIGENRLLPPFDYTTSLLILFRSWIALESFIDLLPAISLPLWTRIK